MPTPNTFLKAEKKRPTPNTFLKAEKKRWRAMTLISLPLGVYHTKEAKTITQGFMGVSSRLLFPWRMLCYSVSHRQREEGSSTGAALLRSANTNKQNWLPGGKKSHLFLTGLQVCAFLWSIVRQTSSTMVLSAFITVQLWYMMSLRDLAHSGHAGISTSIHNHYILLFPVSFFFVNVGFLILVK